MENIIGDAIRKMAAQVLARAAFRSQDAEEAVCSEAAGAGNGEAAVV
jgi:hypothetical protein